MLNNDLGETLVVVLSVLATLSALPFVMARMESSLPQAGPARPGPLASAAPVAREEAVE